MTAKELIKAIQDTRITTHDLPIVVDGFETHGVELLFDEENGYYFNIIT